MTTMGRPTKFHPELCDQAHNYCLLGATNADLAEFFDVSTSTIDNWIARHRDFEMAVKSGRIVADARVALGLYTRAVGYDRKVEREVMIGGELRPVTSTVHYPPNVQACIFWLRHRRRQNWGDRPDDRSTGADEFALLDAANDTVLHHDGD